MKVMQTIANVKKNGASVNSGGNLQIEPPLSLSMEESQRATAIELAKRLRDHYIQRGSMQPAYFLYRFFGGRFDWGDNILNYSDIIDTFFAAMAIPAFSSMLVKRMGEPEYMAFIEMLTRLKKLLSQGCGDDGFKAAVDVVF